MNYPSTMESVALPKGRADDDPTFGLAKPARGCARRQTIIVPLLFHCEAMRPFSSLQSEYVVIRPTKTLHPGEWIVAPL
jgi:hypothetical protein